MLEKLFVFGDSHTIVVQNALNQRAKKRALLPEEERFFVSRFARIKNGQAMEGVTTEKAMELLRSHADAVFVSMIGGNQSNIFGMMQHPTPFDFIEPSMPDVPLREDAQIIPIAVLESVFRSQLDQGDHRKLLTLRECFAGRMFHALPPPPKEDSEFILSKAETYFRANNIELLGVSPALLRLKLWKLQVRLTEEFGAENDIEIMAPPSQALTPEGFLAPEYYGRDATHASNGYGDLQLDMFHQASLVPERAE